MTGAAGQLGTDVVAHLSVAGDDVIGVDRAELDIADAEGVDECLARIAPDVVINCAAFTAVDRCESEVAAAHDVNEHGVRFLADASRRVGAPRPASPLDRRSW